jgi:hypothetical protein
MFFPRLSLDAAQYCQFKTNKTELACIMLITWFLVDREVQIVSPGPQVQSNAQAAYKL